MKVVVEKIPECETVVLLSDFRREKIYVTGDGKHKLTQISGWDSPAKWAFVCLTNSYCFYNGTQETAIQAIQQVMKSTAVLEFESLEEYVKWYNHVNCVGKTS